jgi:hypothetical protein
VQQQAKRPPDSSKSALPPRMTLLMLILLPARKPQAPQPLCLRKAYQEETWCRHRGAHRVAEARCYSHISILAMETVTANVYVTECAKNAKQFDLSTALSDKKWLPSSIKKIKIGLKASKLEDDEFYKQLNAECKGVVETFRNDHNYIYYQLAAKEEKHAVEQRLLTFMTHSFALLFCVYYTKYYAKCADLGKLSRPLDTSATKFLSRFMKGYLQQN